MEHIVLKRFRWRQRLAGLCAAVLCLLPAGLLAASFTASLDNTAIVMGDTANLSFEVEGG